MPRLAGKRALVTGAARGIGAAIAARFRDEGAEVIVNDLDLERARETASRIGATAVAADVADSASVVAMFAEIGAPLHILVNNAGIGGMDSDPDRALERQERSVRQAEERQAGGPIQTFIDVTVELSDEEWQHMLDVHLNGTFYCSREALKIMNAQGSGSIVNMGSIMGTAGGAGAPHYCAAKAGILGFTRALAREVVPRGIRVNAIAPGWISTDMTAPLTLMRPLIELQTPMGRFGDPDDIAWAAIYLASDEAKFVTGQVLSPNGGWHMSQ
ncbi:MAG TPA: SDR family NAD(P)-dependent oxidoreductase [Thermoanaerobaculia bacterium]|nr:SDR family NAD(P)-dependent oxidoreductase [Thermoanaerobaculia bacterium]